MRTRHGIALIEILTVVIILIAFLLVSSKLFAITMREIREVPAAANRVASMEQVRTMMSRDLWNARELHQPDADTMMLLDSHGTLITWHKSADGSLLRDTTDSRATWNDLQFTFKYESGGVVLTQQKRTWTLPAPLITEVKP